jgi:hypothetical protein
LEELVQQLEASLERPSFSTMPFYMSLWNAAARPPWPSTPWPESSRLPLPLPVLCDLIGRHFSATPAALLIVHQQPITRVALLCDYYIDRLRLVLAVVLQPTNAVALSMTEGNKNKPGVCHALVLPEASTNDAEQREALEKQSQWRFIGITLADSCLVQIEVVGNI